MLFPSAGGGAQGIPPPPPAKPSGPVSAVISKFFLTPHWTTERLFPAHLFLLAKVPHLTVVFFFVYARTCPCALHHDTARTMNAF